MNENWNTLVRITIEKKFGVVDILCWTPLDERQAAILGRLAAGIKLLIRDEIAREDSEIELRALSPAKEAR